MHGDVSPKNILIGPRGPVFLDAEGAWYGDPAFDVAFCLNHIVLKALVRADMASDLSRAFSKLCGAYFSQADWEARDGLEQRVGRLLPALMLARIDGKSRWNIRATRNKAPCEALPSTGSDRVLQT